MPTRSSALTRQAGKAHARGLWAALQAISRLAHAGCKAADLEVTAFNGRLFSPRHAPLVEQRRVPDAVVRDVLLSLATESTAAGTPSHLVSRPGRRAARLGLRARSRIRTAFAAEPRSRCRERRASARPPAASIRRDRSRNSSSAARLSPLVEGKTADQILELRVLDPAMGSGAFLVAACQYLADQCEKAMIDEGRWSPGDVTPSDRARSNARSPNGACTASISIPQPCSSRACRCGSPRWPRIGRSRFSITISPPATACWARASRICPSRRRRCGAFGPPRRCRCSTISSPRSWRIG